MGYADRTHGFKNVLGQVKVKETVKEKNMVQYSDWGKDLREGGNSLLIFLVLPSVKAKEAVR